MASRMRLSALWLVPAVIAFGLFPACGGNVETNEQNPGEGGSGGALAIGVGRWLQSIEYFWRSPIAGAQRRLLDGKPLLIR